VAACVAIAERRDGLMVRISERFVVNDKSSNRHLLSPHMTIFIPRPVHRILSGANESFYV
jgi:hypothetical protein